MKVNSIPMYPPERGAWSDALLASSPHLLLLAVIAVLALNTTFKLALPDQVITLGALIGVGVSTVGALALAWRRGWPSWSASWLGYVGLVAFIFAVTPLQELNTPMKSVLERAGIYVFLPLSLGALVYWVTRRNLVEGLLAALPLLIFFWLPVMEFITNGIRFGLMVELWLLCALTAGVLVWLNDARIGIWLVLGASIVSGLSIAYARTYWHNIPPGHFLPPTVTEFMQHFVVNLLASSAWVIGPLLGWSVWRLGQRYGRVGQLAASFAIGGLVLQLFGHVSYWWWFSQRHYLSMVGISALPRFGWAGATTVVYGGLLMTLAGTGWLAGRAWREMRALVFPLVMVPLALPLLAMFSIYFGYQLVPAGLSFELVALTDTTHYLIYLIGLIWLASGGWLITRLSLPHAGAHAGALESEAA